jgi:L-threonylcarbamoyladenylate synthase
MQIQPTPVTAAAVEECVAHLRAGRLVILPTDTVYGIAADVTNDAAVRALYAAKGKGGEAPLQLLFAPEVPLAGYAHPSPTAELLMSALGPGGWTIIVPAADGWDSPALAGGRTVGVRIPASHVISTVVRALGVPLAATSANRHGGTSPTTCVEAISQVGDACAIALDGGPTAAGLDSTVIECLSQPARILREGAIDRDSIARILNVSDIPVLRSVRT